MTTFFSLIKIAAWILLFILNWQIGSCVFIILVAENYEFIAEKRSKDSIIEKILSSLEAVIACLEILVNKKPDIKTDSDISKN